MSIPPPHLSSPPWSIAHTRHGGTAIHSRFHDANYLERVAIRNARAALSFRQAEASRKSKEAANQIAKLWAVVANNDNGDSICIADGVAKNVFVTEHYNNDLSHVWRTHQMRTKQVAAAQSIFFNNQCLGK